MAATQEEIRNVADAIASGALRSSPTLAERLRLLEADLAALQAAAHTVRPADVDRLVAVVMQRYRAMVATLERALPSSDIEEARSYMRGIFGSIKVESDEREIRFVADLRDTHLALLRGVGGSANNVVAGAGFESYVEVRLG